MTKQRLLRTIAAAVLFVAFAFIPSAPANAYPCLRCELIDFGWFSGSEYFCTMGQSGDYENCQSGEGWCWAEGRCQYWLV